ncbi:hypothetical protein AA313_de0200123 [Arthrobotrys entomopaga]|nr:hypothetical protein AA313_de0200123 [Arthrobotrys entomopaga]
MEERTLTPIIQPHIVDYFEGIGLFEPPKNKIRRISTATISPSISSSSSSEVLNLGPSHMRNGRGIFPSADISEPIDHIDLPVELESQETLEFVGFSPEKASDIWNRWLGIPPDLEISEYFEEFALEFVKDPTTFFEDSFTLADDWEDSLKQLGVSEKLSKAILLPGFEDVRCTASCNFWVIQAIEGNFHALEALSAELEHSANYFRSINFKKGGELRVRKTPSLSSSRSCIKPSGEGTGCSRTKHAASDGPSSPRDQSPPKQREDEYEEPGSFITPESCKTKLYRASTLQRAENFYNRETGEATLRDFGSMPGDLSGDTALTYWTPQKEVADRYATYIKHQVSLGHIIITEVEISEDFVDRLNTIKLWGMRDDGTINPDFQEFTCMCRRQRYDAIPSHLCYINKADLVIAHILCHKNSHYTKEKYAGSGWKNITLDDLLKVEIEGEGKLGVQWVFKGYKARSMFNEHAHGKVVQYNVHRLSVVNA